MYNANLSITENLDSVDVQGVWNQPAKRIEF